MDEELTYAAFAAHQEEPFHVQVGADEPLMVTLVSVTTPGQHGPGSAPPTASQAESFSLLFHGPRARVLPQATYQFNHPELGTFLLFIVPIGADEQSTHYEAVFNRLTRPVAPTA
jgi:hypothetical protein